jgi:hypothetical protein
LPDHLIQEEAAAAKKKKNKLKTGDRGTYLTKGSSGTSLRLSPSTRGISRTHTTSGKRQPVVHPGALAFRQTPILASGYCMSICAQDS